MCARTLPITCALLGLLLLLPAPRASAVEALPGGWLLVSAEEISAEADASPRGHAGRGSGEFIDVYGYRWTLATAESSGQPARQLRLDWVREAVLAARGQLETHLRGGESVQCVIYVLPRPREALPVSSCDGLGIYLTPESRRLSRAQVHAIVFHEIGHLVQRQLLPQSDREGWARYRRARGITDAGHFSAHGCHASRPAEIFAEDFRLLYGTARARRCSSLEESGAPEMFDRPDLRSFFSRLFVRGR